MTLTPLTIERFGGLNLLADEFEVGTAGAVSTLNMDLDVRGALRVRDGYTNHTTGAGGTAYRAMYFAEPSTLLAIRGSLATNCTIDALDSSGAVAATVTDHIGVPSLASFASIGTPLATTTYIACSGFTNVKTWSGSAFANAAFTGAGTVPTNGDLLAAWQERLVAAASAVNAKVRFSNAGDATVFGADDVYPDPGDGEVNRALVAFGPYLILFRDTKLFSFRSISTDNDGGAFFNYDRYVHGQIGTFIGYAVATDAIYVLTDTGLYRTIGGPLELVSEMPRAIFNGTLALIPISSTDYFYAPGAAFNRRLFFALPATGSSTLDRTLVYDQLANEWLTWDVAAQSFAVTTYSGSTPKLMFGVPSKHIAKLDTTATTDAGVAIAWSHKSGKYPLSDPGRVAVTQESSLVGTGTVTLRLDSDLYSNQAASAILGTAPTPAEGFPSPVDQEGRWLQYTLSGTGPASVSELKHFISFVKPAGIG